MTFESSGMKVGFPHLQIQKTPKLFFSDVKSGVNTGSTSGSTFGLGGAGPGITAGAGGGKHHEISVEGVPFAQDGHLANTPVSGAVEAAQDQLIIDTKKIDNEDVLSSYPNSSLPHCFSLDSQESLALQEFWPEYQQLHVLRFLYDFQGLKVKAFI